MGATGQGLGVAFVLAGQQPQAQAGGPAFAARQQVFEAGALQLDTLGLEQCSALRLGQAQVLLVEFHQLPRQAQARQVPVRALAAGHQQHQAGGQVVEDELQAAVEHGTLGQVVVIQHQQHGLAGVEPGGEFVQQAVDPLFEGEGLVPLA